MRNTIVHLLVFICVVAGWSQTFYESSSQTQVFTLKAGAKAGPTAINNSSISLPVINNGISVMTLKGSIVVKLPSFHSRSTTIALYDIRGRQVYRQEGITGSALRLDARSFAPGVYSVIFRADGKKFSRVVAISGRGR
jgi:hypothetical protein